MKYFALANRLAFALVAGLAFAACGVTPPDQTSSTDDTMFDVSYGREGNEDTGLNSGDLDDPVEFKFNSSCGEASQSYKDSITQILYRYNRNFAGELDSEGYPIAGHPDAPDAGGISVLVCKDPRLAAYASGQTVAIHEGLLWLLDRSATAHALYSGDELERTLDQITERASGGEFDLASARMSVSAKGAPGHADRLFISALAFVIYHEIGHSALAHNYDTGANKPDPWGVMEIQADYFAASALSSAGYSADGIDLVFDALGRVNPDGSIYHPPADQRADMVGGLAGSGRYVFLTGN
jgi:hypothetical protein